MNTRNNLLKATAKARLKTFAVLSLFLAGNALAKNTTKVILPDVREARTVELTQTVQLRDVPKDSKNVRLWVPIPSDRNWQRVLDISVKNAPGSWDIINQEEGRGKFLYIDISDPKPGNMEVEVSCIVEREGVHFPLGEVAEANPLSIQKAVFTNALDVTAPLMMADDKIRELAGQACGNEADVAKQAVLLIRKVAEVADHYSKDPTKPHCGRGSAQDCLENGGGCCTDLHSLFIAMARARGIAARMQYGYRLLDAKVGTEFDPGYRCWVEFFVPGAGWVPTDIVAADNADEANPYKWNSLGPYRVWLWEGRSFELTPKANAAQVHTMLCGWAEIDGKAVDPLPAADGTPPQMTRKVKFEVINHDRPKDAPKMPE